MPVVAAVSISRCRLERGALVCDLSFLGNTRSTWIELRAVISGVISANDMNFFAVAIAVPLLVWGAVWTFRGSVVLGCLTYLILASAFGPQFASFELAGITLSLDRLVLPAVIMAFVGQRWLASNEPRTVTVAEWWLLAFVALLLANTFLHDWQREAKDQSPIFPHLMEGYLLPALLYVIASRANLSERSWQRILGVLGVFGIYLAVTAFCEVGGAWGLVFPRYIADPAEGIHFGRARGPFLQSVRMGMYLLVGMGAVWLPLVHQGRWGRNGRVLGIALTAALGMAAVLTFTRSIWLGLLLATILLIVTTFEGIWRRGGLLGVAAVVFLTITLSATSIVNLDREDGPQATAESTSMRAVFAYVSWLMFQDHPITGCGFGHFPHEKDNYLNNRSTSLRLETIRGYIHHNTFLSILVELGVFGLILIVGTMIALFRDAKKLWSDEQAPYWMRQVSLLFMLFAIAFAIQMLFHEVSYSPVEFGLYFLLAGLMANAVGMWKSEQRETDRPRPATWMPSLRRPAWG